MECRLRDLAKCRCGQGGLGNLEALQSDENSKALKSEAHPSAVRFYAPEGVYGGVPARKIASRRRPRPLVDATADGQ